MSSPQPTLGQAEVPSIEVVTTSALRQVQISIARVLSSVPSRTGRPREIEKALGLHKTLAWKLAQLTESNDPVTIFQRIPGPGAITKVLDAAASAGVGEPELDAVRASIDDLGTIVDTHAGDSETFIMMLSGFGSGHHAETDLRYRKQAFLATSYLCSIQAETILRTVIVNRTRTDDLDAAVLFGCTDLVRLRSDLAWVINRWRPTDDLGRPIVVPAEPIDEAAPDAPPLIGRVTPDAQRIHRRVLEDGTIEDEIAPGPIGLAGAVSYFTGEVVRGVMSRYRTESSFIMAQNLEVRTPCRCVVFDHLVHKDLFGRVEPQLRVFGELAGRPLWSNVRSDRDRLSVFERVEYRGRGPTALPTRDVPEYPQLVQHCCDRVGWDLEQFDVYRLHMAFPYVPATITYSYPLPEKP